jgi:hypothetical protein
LGTTDRRRYSVADAGLFIGWGEVVRGREERAIQVFNESVQYYGGLQQEGRIESFEVCLLEPHGGDLQGFVLLRGTQEQMDAVLADEEFERQLTRANLIVEGLGIVSAALGEELGRQMSVYQNEVAELA